MTYQYKRPVFFILAYISCGIGTALAGDNTTDSLIKVLGLMKDHDTAMIKLLNKISSSFHSDKPRIALRYAQDAFQHSEKLGKSSDTPIIRCCRRSTVSALLNIGQAYNMLGENDSAMIFFSKAFHAANKWDNLNGKADALYGIGAVHYGLGNYDKAARFFIKALDWFEESNDRQGASYALLALGFMHYYQRNFDKALECYDQSLKIAEEDGDRNGVAYALNKIGFIYMDKEDFDKAVDYQKRALQIREELKDKTALASSYNDLAATFYTAARIMAGGKSGQNVRGKYELAREYFMKSLALEEEIGNQWGVALTLVNIGSVNTDLGLYEEALAALNRCKEISIKISSKDGLKGAYAALAEYYARMGDYKYAYENYALFSQYSDSMLNEETSRQVVEMQTKYESEKKEKEIMILKKDKEIQNSEVRRQTLMRNSFIGAASLALLLALVLYNRYRIKQKANIQLSEQNARIQMQKTVIQEQKQNIIDSIEYASNIQQAMLPTDEEFRKLFPESFILFRPRDIVSGDFYWVAGVDSPLVKGVRGIDKDLINPPSPPFSKGEIPAITNSQPAMFACCDCTGHGVPGAFMSMLCTELLNEAVNDKGLAKPNEIFEEVRKGIIGALKQRTGETGNTRYGLPSEVQRTTDGMDATIIALRIGNVKTPNLARSDDRVGVSTLHAACANNPVYLVSKGALTEIPPDRFPVGVHEGEPKSFTLHEKEVNHGDMIYTVTDGFEDQLGGEKGKKYKSGKLKKLLLLIAEKPIDEQKHILEKTFEEWKGYGEQTDDVTIIGIRV